ncbi:hypothetical protein EYV94_27110 [Puteibacter caeruleilacunae]|nr:hypothetical protein EYV94_27110 [Puteibacter caeruleilacunae]
MKKTILFSLHGFIWFCDLCIIFLATLAGNLWANENVLNGLTGFLGLALWSLILFYIGYSFIVPKIFSQGKIFEGIVAISITGLASSFIMNFEDVISVISGNGGIDYSFSGFIQVAFLSIFICASGVFLRLFINWINEEQKKKELENERIKMKLQVLVNQNNPHFIFNVLNNIDSLITSKPARASETINKLSTLLRYNYTNSENDKVPIRSEIEYIENYIELQSLRLDHEINVQWEVSPRLEGINIVPLIFLPFVENAFKHGNTDNNHPIQLRVDLQGNEVHFECKNSYNSSNTQKAVSGFGISNIVKRLDLMYADNYKLNIENEKEIYSVSLILKVDED